MFCIGGWGIFFFFWGGGGFPFPLILFCFFFFFGGGFFVFFFYIFFAVFFGVGGGFFWDIEWVGGTRGGGKKPAYWGLLKRKKQKSGIKRRGFFGEEGGFWGTRGILPGVFGGAGDNDLCLRSHGGGNGPGRLAHSRERFFHRDTESYPRRQCGTAIQLEVAAGLSWPGFLWLDAVSEVASGSVCTLVSAILVFFSLKAVGCNALLCGIGLLRLRTNSKALR